MSREEIHKLLGGYATGTLTASEKQALFLAALEDQELFDALANEQPLRDLLQEPAARTRLLTALEESPAPWYSVWWRPAAAALAMAGVAVFAVVLFRGKPAAPVVEIAQVKSHPNLKEFHAPPPAGEARGRVEIARPPAVFSPSLETKPLPVPSAIPAAPAPPRPEMEAASAGSLTAPEPKPAEPKPAEPRTMATFRAASPMMVRTAAPVADRLGIRYTILRKEENGEFEPAGAEELRKGDVIQLRFQFDQSGYLSVSTENGQGTRRPVAFGFVPRMSPFTTPVLPAGTAVLYVSFSRQEPAAVAGYVDQTADASAREPVDDPGKQSVSLGLPLAGQSLTFPIRLTYR